MIATQYGIPAPKLLVIAQKRSGSHYLQNSIRCKSLTGIALINHVRDGGSINPIDKALFRHHSANFDTLFLRFHDFDMNDHGFIEWLTFATEMIRKAHKIVVLERKSVFMHALTDWYGDNVFDRSVKRKESHQGWVEYRNQLILENPISREDFQRSYKKACVFYRLFGSLYADCKHKCKTVFFEELQDIASVVEDISCFAGFSVGIDPVVDGEYPKWEVADYAPMLRKSEILEEFRCLL